MYLKCIGFVITATVEWQRQNPLLSDTLTCQYQIPSTSSLSRKIKCLWVHSIAWNRQMCTNTHRIMTKSLFHRQIRLHWYVRFVAVTKLRLNQNDFLEAVCWCQFFLSNFLVHEDFLCESSPPPDRYNNNNMLQFHRFPIFQFVLFHNSLFYAKKYA